MWVDAGEGIYVTGACARMLTDTVRVQQPVHYVWKVMSTITVHIWHVMAASPRTMLQNVTVHYGVT